MILVDANLLLYAKIESFPQHEVARAWLDERISGHAPVGLPWESLLAFLRIATSPRVFERPLPVDHAWAQVEGWTEQRSVWIPEATERHFAVLGSLLGHSGAKGRLVMDAHLAALAIEHGLILCSADGDFARFRDLRWENPLSA